MKINFDEVDYKEMYKVGNVIMNSDNMLFLVAEGSEYGYVLVNLSKNMVTRAYETDSKIVSKKKYERRFRPSYILRKSVTIRLVST